MKNIMCLFGHHVYSQASAEVNVVDERDGHLVCRVRNCCLRCGKLYEDIPMPMYLFFPNCGARMEGEEG